MGVECSVVFLVLNVSWMRRMILMNRPLILDPTTENLAEENQMEKVQIHMPMVPPPNTVICLAFEER